MYLRITKSDSKVGGYYNTSLSISIRFSGLFASGRYSAITWLLFIELVALFYSKMTSTKSAMKRTKRTVLTEPNNCQFLLVLVLINVVFFWVEHINGNFPPFPNAVDDPKYD